MREHRGSNTGEQDVQATNQGGRVKDGGRVKSTHSIGNLTVNIDTSSLQATIEDAKWKMKPPIETMTLSIGGKMRFKGERTWAKEIKLQVSREMAKALRKEMK